MGSRPLIKGFWDLSRSERTGVWVLSSLLMLLLILAILAGESLPNKPNYDYSELEKQISLWDISDGAHGASVRETSFTDLDAPRYADAKARLTPVEFNPNTASEGELKALGLTTKQVNSIIRFRQNGSGFKTKSDFNELYLISDEEYAVLEPFIQLPDVAVDSRKSERKDHQKGLLQVELNSADSTALLQIDGIGPAFARKIVAYRKKLRGFVAVQQLMEVKGMDSSRYRQIKPFVNVNPFLVQRMNVNTASLEELRSHPYIGANIALSLVNYRKQHGNFVHLSDIKKSALVTEDVYVKISPYLTVE